MKKENLSVEERFLRFCKGCKRWRETYCKKTLVPYMGYGGKILCERRILKLE